MVYSFEAKKRILKHVRMGITPIENIAKIRKIPKQTIYRWIRRQKCYGDVGLQNKKPGAKPTQIRGEFVEMVITCGTNETAESTNYGAPCAPSDLASPNAKSKKSTRNTTLK